VPVAQWVLNLTSLQMARVDWPGHPSLATLASGDQIMQILIWVPALNKWMRIGSQGKGIDAHGTVNVTFAEFTFLAQSAERGLPLDQALAMLLTR
jgi:hypothetical protein